MGNKLAVFLILFLFLLFSRKSLEQPQNHQDPYPLLGNLPQIAQQ